MKYQNLSMTFFYCKIGPYLLNIMQLDQKRNGKLENPIDRQY